MAASMVTEIAMAHPGYVCSMIFIRTAVFALGMLSHESHLYICMRSCAHARRYVRMHGTAQSF